MVKIFIRKCVSLYDCSTQYLRGTKITGTVIKLIKTEYLKTNGKLSSVFFCVIHVPGTHYQRRFGYCTFQILIYNIYIGELYNSLMQSVNNRKCWMKRLKK